MESPHGFVDRAIASPYALWNHRHCFSAVEGGTKMLDRVTYALPLGPLGWMVHAALVKHDVEEIFDFRGATMQRLFPS
jgi:ligand-binding SRPBCC domain-containing protein